jgi:hypothetical protein
MRLCQGVEATIGSGASLNSARAEIAGSMDASAVLQTRTDRSRKDKGNDTAVQERCGSSGTSLSLSAIRSSSGGERALIFCIALLRWT